MGLDRLHMPRGARGPMQTPLAGKLRGQLVPASDHVACAHLGWQIQDSCGDQQEAAGGTFQDSQGQVTQSLSAPPGLSGTPALGSLGP